MLHFYFTVHLILQLVRIRGTCVRAHLDKKKSWIQVWKEMSFDFVLFDLGISWLALTSTVCSCSVIVNPSASDKDTNPQNWTINIPLKGFSGSTLALSWILHRIKQIEFIVSGLPKKKNHNFKCIWSFKWGWHWILCKRLTIRGHATFYRWDCNLARCLPLWEEFFGCSDFPGESVCVWWSHRCSGFAEESCGFEVSRLRCLRKSQWYLDWSCTAAL